MWAERWQCSGKYCAFRRFVSIEVSPKGDRKNIATQNGEDRDYPPILGEVSYNSLFTLFSIGRVGETVSTHRGRTTL
jgi:hypothetical protein